MIKLCCAFTILTGTLLLAHSGDTLDVPYGVRPVIDGQILAGEWDDADTVMTANLPNGPVVIFFKENPETLYMAIAITDTTYNAFDNATIYFDTLHNAGTAPQTDDFGCGSHRGGMFVEFNGNGSGWNIGTQTGWIGAINSTILGWSAEFSISYNKLGIATNVPKTLGFCTTIGDLGNAFVAWPSTVNSNIPNTWADIYSSTNWAQPDTILPQVSVVMPNGGENWDVNSFQAILWFASDNIQVDSVNIYYSTNDGTDWLVIATGEPNDSSYIWLVPNTPSESCLVQITAFDPSANSSVDISDSLFIISAVGIKEGSSVFRTDKAIIQTNPSRTAVWFFNISAGLANLTVYDVTGKKLYENESIVKNNALVWRSDLRSGVYFYILKIGNKICKGKLILVQ